MKPRVGEVLWVARKLAALEVEAIMKKIKPESLALLIGKSGCMTSFYVGP